MLAVRRAAQRGPEQDANDRGPNQECTSDVPVISTEANNMRKALINASVFVCSGFGTNWSVCCFVGHAVKNWQGVINKSVGGLLVLKTEQKRWKAPPALRRT